MAPSTASPPEPPHIGDTVRHTQSGNTRSYAVWVVIGALVVIAVIFFWPSAAPVVGMVR